MNFVMTGHKGLIGSSLLERLLSEGHMPISLIDLRLGDRRHRNDSKDIRHMAKWKLDTQVDVLFHLASFCKIKDCIKNPELAFEHNVRGTHAMMEFCALNNIPKVVFTSSTRVLYPEKNPYTASKIYGEELVKSYGLEYVIVRPSTVYGPFNDLTRRLIHLWVTAAFAGEELKIFGDENKTLDFTYIDDFVNALYHLSWDINTTSNVGTGREVLLKDVAQHIIDIVGKGTIGYYPAEKLQPQNVVINTDFRCNTRIKDGLKKTIEFYQTIQRRLP